MTVKELRELLAKCNDDASIIVECSNGNEAKEVKQFDWKGFKFCYIADSFDSIQDDIDEMGMQEIPMNENIENKPNVVYLVTYQWNSEAVGDPQTFQTIFKNYKDAKDKFDAYVKDDKESNGGCGYSAINYPRNGYIIDEDSEKSYFAYLDGFATSDFTSVTLEEKEVK